MAEHKSFPLRISPDLYRALERWAADDLRSVNAQIEFLLGDAVRRAGRGHGRGRAGQVEPDSSQPAADWSPPDDT